MNQESFIATIDSWRSVVLSGNVPARQGIIPFWYKTKKIEIIAETGIKTETIELVKQTIEAVIYQIFFNNSLFNVSVSTKNVDAYIQYFVDNKDMINDDKFVVNTYKSLIRQKKYHAVIFITKHGFFNDYISWGRSAFNDGCMILALSGNRQENQEFLGSVVRHESVHLLGSPAHCDDLREVEGYSYNRCCNMHSHVPSEIICEKCKDLVRLWWQGLN